MAWGLTAIVAIAAATIAFAQSSSAVIQPFTINIDQAVPVSVLVGVDNVTYTVPMTVNVALAIRIDSPLSFTLGIPQAAVIDVVPDGIDDLGIPYTIETSNDTIEITEWTAFANRDDELSFAGEIYLVVDADPVSDIVATVRLYDDKDKLVDVIELINVAYGLNPGGYNRFDGRVPFTEPDSISRYSVEFKIVRE